MMRFAWLLLAATLPAWAEFPIQDMNWRNLGVEYSFRLRGQDITEAKVPSHEVLHLVNIAYAPMRFLALEGGIGIDRLHVDPYDHVSFQGEFGISPALGFSLLTPPLFRVLRLGAGSSLMYFNSEDGDFLYSGWMGNSHLGLKLSPSPRFDLSLGMRYFTIDGTMEDTKAQVPQEFSNGKRSRGFISLNLKSPTEKAFLTLDVEMFPDLGVSWSDGPNEASIGIAFGTSLGGSAPFPDNSKYFPSYDEMKAKQKKMDEDLE